MAELQNDIENEMITLQSSDGKLFKVNLQTAKMSATISNLLEDLELASTGASFAEPIPLPNVNGKILEKVVEFCNHCVKTGGEASGEAFTTWFTEYITPFCQNDHDTLFEIILAANYLDVAKLLDLSCKAVAEMIKGKTPEEIRVIFNIKNDFSPEEEEEIKRENSWIEDLDKNVNVTQ